MVYQFGVKGMLARKHVHYQFFGGCKEANINGHQFGLEENDDYIGVVCLFAVKGMRARKRVQNQVRVDGRHVHMGTSLGWRKS